MGSCRIAPGAFSTLGLQRSLEKMAESPEWLGLGKCVPLHKLGAWFFISGMRTALAYFLRAGVHVPARQEGLATPPGSLEMCCYTLGKHCYCPLGDRGSRMSTAPHLSLASLRSDPRSN